MPDLTTTTQDDQASMSWQDALKRLKDGNDRFVNNKSPHRILQRGMKQAAGGQYPFAVLLSCMDSRTPSEIIFDQGLGDIFNIRIAGNFVNTDVLGSMEFACKLAGSKLIGVIGHTDCGAIKGACDHVELGNLTSVLKQIQPAVQAAKRFPGRSLFEKSGLCCCSGHAECFDCDAKYQRSQSHLKRTYRFGKCWIGGWDV